MIIVIRELGYDNLGMYVTSPVAQNTPILQCRYLILAICTCLWVQVQVHLFFHWVSFKAAEASICYLSQEGAYEYNIYPDY